MLFAGQILTIAPPNQKQRNIKMEESTLKKENTIEKVEKENDVITNDKTDTAVQKAKSLIIKLEDLVPFKDHPYKVIKNEGMI